MRSWIPALALAIVTSIGLAPTFAEAKRLGGGGSSGMQRSLPARPAAPATPQQATPAPSPGQAGAAAAPQRNWLGPVAGLAAGLGLAALMSHLGLGAEFANLLMLMLLALVAIVVFRRLFTPRTAARPAAAGNVGAAPPTPRVEPALQRAPVAAAPAGGQRSADGSTLLAPLGAAPASALPPGFDADAFNRMARTIFVRLQAANDAADLEDLRAFTTPEMFAVARLELQDRGGNAQTTDVVQVDAEVLDFEQQGDRQVVSVRYHGRIREEADGPVTDFDEVWHLMRWGDDAGWKIAGIQQRA